MKGITQIKAREPVPEINIEYNSIRIFCGELDLCLLCIGC